MLRAKELKTEEELLQSTATARNETMNFDKNDEFCTKHDEFSLKLTPRRSSITLKMMDFVLKMMDFVLQSPLPRGVQGQVVVGGSGLCLNEDSSMENDDSSIEKDDFPLKNEVVSGLLELPGQDGHCKQQLSVRYLPVNQVY